jgi:hypothetical protein
MGAPRSAIGMSRRAWLLGGAAGAAALVLELSRLRDALAAQAIEPGVARVEGAARINGRPARPGMAVGPGDVMTTGTGSQLVAVVGADAFLARANTRVELGGGAAAFAAGTLRVVTGALLSVFPPGEGKRILTPTAAIGIRGTGIYIEIQGVRTYVCTCYGEAELAPVDDPAGAETVRTRHHEEPRYIYSRGAPRMIERAPVVNHTDAELTLLEGLVGRRVPFEPSAYPPGTPGAPPR